MSVTSVALVLLFAAFTPFALPGYSPDRPTPTPPPASRTQQECPRPGVGAFDTDAILLCLAASYEKR